MYLAQENQFIQKLKIILNSNLFFLFFFSIVILNIYIKITNIKSVYNENTETVIGTIYDIKITENSTVINVHSKENLVVYYTGNNTFQLGDKIKIIGSFAKISKNTIFNLFDYKKYYLSKNIKYSVKSDKIDILKKKGNIL